MNLARLAPSVMFPLSPVNGATNHQTKPTNHPTNHDQHRNRNRPLPYRITHRRDHRGDNCPRGILHASHCPRCHKRSGVYDRRKIAFPLPIAPLNSIPDNQPTNQPTNQNETMKTMKTNQSKIDSIKRRINRLEWRAYSISPTDPHLWEVQQELFRKIDKLREELDSLEGQSKVY